LVELGITFHRFSRKHVTYHLFLSRKLSKAIYENSVFIINSTNMAMRVIVPQQRFHAADPKLVSVCPCTSSQTSCRRDSTTRRRWCRDELQWHSDARRWQCSTEYTACNRHRKNQDCTSASSNLQIM